RHSPPAMTPGHANYGRTRDTRKNIARAMASQPLGLDAYPYVAASTVLDPKFLRMAERVFVTWSKGAPEQTGRDLADIAKEWGVPFQTAVERLQPAGAVYFTMDEGD